MADEYPKWVEPDPSHFIYLEAGQHKHSTGFEHTTARGSKKTFVKVANADEERLATSPALIKGEKAALIEADVESPAISLDELIHKLAHVRQQFPDLFGPAITKLAEKVQELGSLAEHERALRSQAEEVQRRLDDLRASLADELQKLKETREQAIKGTQAAAEEILAAARKKAEDMIAAAERMARAAEERAAASDRSAEQARRNLEQSKNEHAVTDAKRAALVSEIERLKAQFA